MTAPRKKPEQAAADLIFSAHALERMEEMGVTEDECRSARAYPVRCYRSIGYAHEMYQGRRITISVAQQLVSETVVTVLWTDQDLYRFMGRKTITGDHA